MRKPRLLVGLASAALLLGLAGPVTAATSTYATSETGGDGTNVGATGAPDFAYGAPPKGLYTQLDNLYNPGSSMTASFDGSLCQSDSAVDLVIWEAGTSDPLKVTVNGLTAITDGVETPYSIGGPLNPDGTFRSYNVPAEAGPFTTVVIQATRVDPRPYAEIDAVQCSNAVPALTALSPVHAWLGLKSTDDQGTQFDVYAELLDQSANVVATGLTRCVSGITRNPALAQDVIVSWNQVTPLVAASAEDFDLRLSTRIGTNPDGTKCGPSGHNSALGLRLYYDSTARLSRFDMTVASPSSTDEYLHSNGAACANAPSVGATNLYFDENLPTATTAAAAKCKDSASVNFAGSNPLKVIGVWNGDTTP